MKIFHQEIKKRWHEFSLIEQMANIGAEVGRAVKWRKKREKKIWQNAFYRALELLDFTIDDPKNKNSLKEILRLRELLVDYFAGDNLYHSKEEDWEKYFYPFLLAASLRRYKLTQTTFSITLFPLISFFFPQNL